MNRRETMGQLEPPRRALDENVNAILTVNAASFLKVGFGMFGQVTEFGFAFELSETRSKIDRLLILKGRLPIRRERDQTNLSNDGADQPIVLDNVVLVVRVGTVASVLSKIVTSADVLVLVDLDGTADDVVLLAGRFTCEVGTGVEDIFGTRDQAG
jgi:hypothetical protein